MITVDLPDGSSIDVDTDDEQQAAMAARKYLQKQSQLSEPGQSQTAQDQPAQDQPTAMDWLKGGIQAAGAIGSSLITEPIAGYAGLTAAMGQNVNVPGYTPPDPEEVMNKVRSLGYSPDSPEARQILQKISGGAQAVADFFGNPLQKSRTGLGDYVFEKTGSPALGAIGYAAPDAILQGAGSAVAKGASRIGGAEMSAETAATLDLAKKSNLPVLTSDVIKPETFGQKTMQQLGEKLGFIGTGSKRAYQQKARESIVQGIADEFGVDLNSSVDADIVKSIEKGVAQKMERAATLREEAISNLNSFGAVKASKTIDAIDRALNEQRKLKDLADPELIKKLTDIKNTISKTDTETGIASPTANFELMAKARSVIIDDIIDAYKGQSKTLTPKAVAKLQPIKSAIDDDLNAFAKLNDRRSAAQWLVSNRVFSDTLSTAKEGVLKNLLTKGESTPEVVANIIKRGRPSELKRVNRYLDEKGKSAARTAIIRDALIESGYFKDGPNPTRFANAMLGVNRQKAVGVFFEGKAKKEIEGISRLLNTTKRAQEASVSTNTGQQLFAPVAAIGLGSVGVKVAVPLAVGLGAITKTYESSGVRNLLIKLAETKPGSKAEIELRQKIEPIFAASIGLAQSEASAQDQQNQGLTIPITRGQ